MTRREKARFLVAACVILLVSVSGVSLYRMTELVKISGGLTVPDMRLGYTGNEVETLFYNLGSGGRESYKEFLFFDLLFIAVLACIQTLLINWFCRRLQFHPRWRNLKIPAYVRAVFDALENIFILILLFTYPRIPTGIAAAAAISTTLKWIFTAAVFAVIGGCAVIYARNFIFHKEEYAWKNK
jgi:hypothetical protein